MLENLTQRVEETSEREVDKIRSNFLKYVARGLVLGVLSFSAGYEINKYNSSGVESKVNDKKAPIIVSKYNSSGVESKVESKVNGEKAPIKNSLEVVFDNESLEKKAYTGDKEKTPEHYGIEMSPGYNIGSFLCTEISQNSKSKGLDGFKGINKGLTFRLDEEGELKVVGDPTYEENDTLYLVIYNPERKNHKFGLNITQVIEESGVKFIDDKPYEVKFKRGKLIEKKPVDYEFKETDLFYDLYKKKIDVVIGTKSEVRVRKGPFELKGNHKAFQLEKLGVGTYSAVLEVYEGNEADEADGCIPISEFRIE